MKIILSRKGADSSNVGVASPIFENGQLLSLPIPDPAGVYAYSDIASGVADIATLGELVTRLPRARARASDRVHLDPDLRSEAVDRAAGWRPVFGQDGAAESHLENQSVGVGDLFLFFGWFRRVQTAGAKLRYVPGAPDLHVVFGWMQVGSMISLGHGEPAPAWCQDHPHLRGRRSAQNTLYVSADRLTLDGRDHGAGADTFGHLRPELVLTGATETSRSRWHVPPWFAQRSPRLSYHDRDDCWTLFETHARLESNSIGQEFVLDTTVYPEAVPWAAFVLGAEPHLAIAS
jgi:hypothetical protein